MLKKLHLNNFTAFGESNLYFSSGLNVIVGENGLGKTHLLKLPYVAMALSAELGRESPSPQPSKKLLQPRMAQKLMNVFRPESLGRLARRKQGRNRCEVEVEFEASKWDLSFSFATQSKSEVVVEKTPRDWLDKAPVFLPTRELLTIYPGFVPLYQGRHLEFEETWYDTCALLGAPALRGPTPHKIAQAVRRLENELGGQIVLDKKGRFYLKQRGVGKMEMPLVAEGHRKLAMLIQLIATGSLLDKGCLFWDEPESNLNSKLIREISRTILDICRNGVQVIVATHSLFLLRELEILLKKEFENIEQRYFALGKNEKGLSIHQTKSIREIEPLTALDEELTQSDRFLEKFNYVKSNR